MIVFFAIVFQTLRAISDKWDDIEFNFLFLDGQWWLKCIIAENTNHSTTSNDRTLLNLDFREANYGIKLADTEINTTFLNITLSRSIIAHSVFCWLFSIQINEEFIFLKLSLNRSQILERLCYYCFHLK